MTKFGLSEDETLLRGVCQGVMHNMLVAHRGDVKKAGMGVADALMPHAHIIRMFTLMMSLELLKRADVADPTTKALIGMGLDMNVYYDIMKEVANGWIDSMEEAMSKETPK